MVKDDMEITEARDSENNVEELGSKALVSENENTKAEGEILPCMVADAVNVNKSDDVGESLNELEKYSEDVTKIEWKETTNPQTEIKEPKIIEESTGQLDDVTKTAEKINSENNFDEQTPNKQSDAKNDVAEQSASNDVVEKDDKSIGNGVEGGNPAENEVEENPIGDFAVEKQEDSESTYHNANTRSQLKTTQVPIDEPPSESAELVKVMPVGDQEKEVAAYLNEERAVNDVLKHPGKEIHPSSPVAGENTMNIETAVEHKGDHPSIPIKHEASTPSFASYSPAKAEDQSGETVKTVSQAALPLMAEDDDGTREEQAAFMKEIESFYRERATDFKPPKFYGQPLNCLKLWRAVIRLGGYDRVTGSKLWRQVGESFHPPKTCTTVSWTFRIFYEKSLLEYEKHKIQSGELQLPVAALNDGADTEGNGVQGAGSGKARRDSAARAMHGWHVQHHFDNGEDKRVSNTPKREKIVKAIGSLKQKRPNEVEHPSKAARVETSKQYFGYEWLAGPPPFFPHSMQKNRTLATTIVDVGPPADWVKINVRQMTDSFEVYALVPGLLREEVRVQSDPAGRLVIIGQPEQVDNPWGITPFKKVISLPLRIDPLQTSAVVSLHGRLFVRVPFEQTNG